MEDEELRLKLYKINDIFVRLRRKVKDEGTRAVISGALACLRTEFPNTFFDSEGELNKECLDDE